MFTFRSCSSGRKLWLLINVIALLTLASAYDPCPEHLRRSKAAKPSDIPKDEIEKAFQEAEIIVNRRKAQEQRLVREGKVINRKIKSAESVHQQATVIPEVREKENRQITFQEASAILTKKYRLPPDEVCCSLPKADLTSPAAARAVQNCVNPNPITCDPLSKYRTADGTCNNLENPTWGSAFSCFNRLLPAKYSDNDGFRRSVTGARLPEPRTLSLNIHAHQDSPTYDVNQMYMFLGQLLDHDLTLTASSGTVDNEAIRCCPPSSSDHPQCAPIIASFNDPFYSNFSISCLNFVRSAICDYCTTGPRVQINTVTAFIDASFLYGNSESETNDLRDPNMPGNLRVQRTTYGDFPPPSNNPQNDRCSIQEENQICFQTGDSRGNQQPTLTSLHVVFIRLHNCIATQFRKINPHWKEEKIFQETKKIVGAVMQVIVWKEYLPITLGDAVGTLMMSPGVETTVYDSSVDPTLYTEFSTASFRFGHTFINKFLPEIPGREGHNGHLLRDVFFQPFDLLTGEMDPLVRGMTRSPSQNFDRHMVPDVTNFLYRIRGNDTGLDLASFNIQRGRDHGLPTYADVAEFCSGGLIVIKSFNDLHQLMPHESVEVVRRNYRDPRDIDLFTGTILEYQEVGAVIGPTAICIIRLQFEKLKYGDRFYFEHEGVFTPSQLSQLKNVTLASILCSTTEIEEMQEEAMRYPSYYNPIRPCSSLPKMDLNAWRESEDTK